MNFFDDYYSESQPQQEQTNWQRGLCVGGKIRSHDSFEQEMLQPEQKSRELEDDEGFVFDCGHGVRIKRMR